MQKVRDSEKPAHGQQVLSACAFIHKIIDGKEKVFLAKRADHRKFLPGVYELPGGHIDFGEDMETGLVREILEEFGKRIEVADPFYVFTYTNRVKGSHSIEVIYFARFLEPSDDIHLDPDNHSTSGWFAEDEVSQATTHDKGADDPEFRAIHKGFAILRGEKLKV